MEAPCEVTLTAVLEFESRAWVHAGAKERAITEELGLSATRYYQLLRDALLDPVAVAAYPQTAARLHRILWVRQQGRSQARWAG